MNEEQARALAEAVVKAAGNGCPRCFAGSTSQPTKVQELVSELDREGVTTFVELDAIKSKRKAEADAKASAQAALDSKTPPESKA